MTGLPRGWAEVRLGDVVVNRDRERIPVNVKDRSARSGDVRYYGAAGQVGWIDWPLFDERLLLLGEDGVQFFDADKTKAYMISGPSWVNNHAHVLSEVEGASISYLMNYLNQFNYQGYANGTTRLKLTRSAMDEIPVRLAPTAEQERIVTAIEEAFSKLDAGEAGLRTVRQLLKRMRDAILTAAVTGRLVPQDPTETPAAKLLADLGERPNPDLSDPLPSGWEWCQLQAVSVLQEYGLSLKAHETRNASDVPMLRMGNLQGGAIAASNLKFVSASHEEVQARRLQAGDLLFNRTNSAELVGKSAVYFGIPADATFASYLIRVRLAPGVVPSWCAAAINSQHGRRYIDSVAVQQVGQANVNGTKLKQFPIPLPPMEEQRRIVAEVERQLSFVEACERAVDVGLARSAGLRRSVLKAAFEGRLVPQDPSDEPASVLLDRIRAERMAPPVAKRRARQTA